MSGAISGTSTICRRAASSRRSPSMPGDSQERDWDPLLQPQASGQNAQEFGAERNQDPALKSD